ncbi:MAG TPA: bifunctional phosphoglucose/phosphomannose isomerase [Bacteroidota bacterium]|nr:bifunctional phosphoglucose/phosphomannose isomerase [Bacteroidota bacterium]
MKETTISLYDRSDMRALLTGFPHQVEDAVRIGREARLVGLKGKPSGIVVSGLGGSAIGGDLLRSYLWDQVDIPFLINRQYTLPHFAGPSTLVIISSYSGNTEETIASYHEAMKRKAQVVCFTSGGEIAALARKNKQALVLLPRGYPPRAALGYSFFPMMLALARYKIIPSQDAAIRETVALLKKLSVRYRLTGQKNLALELARQLYNKLPVIYSSSERIDAVNLRWRGQIAENAKTLAFGHVFPEMNHNEIVGWKVLRRMMEEAAVVYLHDREDHPRVTLRMEIARGIIGEYASRIIDVKSEGKSRLARMFSLVHLGDWTSFYLAMLNGVDPTPVNVIDYLKRQLDRK